MESIFISGGSNTTSTCCKWISLDDNFYDQNRVTDGILVYAMNNIIAISTIYNDSKQTPAVLCTLRGHKGFINSIDYIKNSNYLYIYSCSDLTIKIWRCKYSISSLESFCQWHEYQTLLGNFQASIQLLSCLSIDQNCHFIVGSDSSGKCVSWLCKYSDSIIPVENGANNFSIIDEFKVQSIQMANALNLIKLPTMKSNTITILLVSGCVDSKIHLRATTLDYETKTFPVFSYIGSLVGHEEWITSISSYCDSDNNILLATGSQDWKVRIWRITATFLLQSENSDSAILTQSDVSNNHVDEGDDGDNIEGDEGDVELVPEENLSESRLTFHIFGTSYSIFFDALLLGHEDWITSVHWKRAINGTVNSNLQLFTTSMDRNMIIWKPDTQLGGVWQPITRFGDIGGTLGGSIGANLLGFINGNVSSDGTAVLGVGFGGSFHLWKHNMSLDRWFPEPYLSGHFGSVNDISWATDGSYLISVSSDQTCRLFAPILRAQKSYWHEISRPQIHGYDLHTIAMCPKPSLMIFTGGDEKLIRQFDAPVCVIEGMKKLSSIEWSNYDITSDRTYRAFIPELGLSNKAYDLISKQEREELDARNVSTLDWSSIPLESQLSDYTIWPEIKKLYGHSNDVVITAITKCGKYLASSSKARNPATAGIIIWDTSTMLMHQTLLVHESTVVCLRFSQDDKYLISAGKDRTLCVYAYDSNRSAFSIFAAKKNAHKRIIWDAAWVSNDLLCSVSRDGMCKLWKFESESENTINELKCIHSFLPFNEVSITSVDILNDFMAVGSELGDISIFKISKSLDDDVKNSENEVYSTFITSVDSVFAHGSSVKRVRWRPLINADMTKYLSTCSEDFSVRIFKFTIV
jgi:elongator complex protein 2